MAGYQPGQNSANTTDFPGTGSNTEPLIPYLGVTAKEAGLPLLKQRGVPVPPNLSPAQALALQDTGTTSSRWTAGEALADFYQKTHDQLIPLQGLLISAGLADPKKLTPGLADEETYDAYKTAVRRAVLSGKTIEEVLDEAARTAGGAAGAAARSRAPLQITLTNPADIELLSKKVGQATIGRWLSAQEEQQAVKGYQGQEASAQTAAYNANISGGTSTAAPSPQAFIEQQARAQHPLEAQGHDVANVMDTFLGLLGGQR